MILKAETEIVSSQKLTEAQEQLILFPSYFKDGVFDGEKFDRDTKEVAQFMCLVLRHKPSIIGAKVDEHGWMNTKDLLVGLRDKGFKFIGKAELKKIVERDTKTRFSFGGEDDEIIRANYGHSIPIDLEYEPVEPPLVLYHGSCSKYHEDIQKLGLLQKDRNYVHLTDDITTAIDVGDRHRGGVTDIYYIKAKEMFRDGLQFYVANGVWLTKSVPTKYFFDYAVTDPSRYTNKVPRYIGNKKYIGNNFEGILDEDYNLITNKKENG